MGNFGLVVNGVPQSGGADVIATLAVIAAYIDTEVAAILAAVDTEVAAIKAKTDNLPSDPADASDIAALITTAQNTSGTQAATLDTEHTLATVAAAKTYILVVDTNAMLNADVLILKAYTKTLTGSTSRVCYQAIFSNIQAEPVKISPMIFAPHEVKFTLEQTDGTGRSYDWSVIEVLG